MAVELTEMLKYSDSELREMGKTLDLKLAPNLGKGKMIEAIQREAIRRQKELELEVTAQLRQEATVKLGLTATKKRPSPENVAIIASKKKYVVFINRENSGADGEMGADVQLLKGDYAFHLWDGMKHVLPECLVAEVPEAIPEVFDRLTEFFVTCGMKPKRAREQASETLKRLSLRTSCQNPIYADVKTARGEKISQRVGSQGRFSFEVIGDAPATEPFGLVEKQAVAV